MNILLTSQLHATTTVVASSVQKPAELPEAKVRQATKQAAGRTGVTTFTGRSRFEHRTVRQTAGLREGNATSAAPCRRKLLRNGAPHYGDACENNRAQSCRNRPTFRSCLLPAPSTRSCTFRLQLCHDLKLCLQPGVGTGTGNGELNLATTGTRLCTAVFILNV
jgi:hypothetical protein